MRSPSRMSLVSVAAESSVMPTTLSQVVARSAQLFGNRPAVVSGDQQLTWTELDLQCGQLCTVLSELGVHRGDRVALFIPKSVHSMVAVHGTFRAGAAYVPVDPQSPAAHLATILQDASVHVLITDPRLKRTVEAALLLLHAAGAAMPAVVGLAPSAELRAGVDLSAHITSRTWDDVLQSAPSSGPEVDPDDLAYVMYTSGSTGTPKGIMHSHRSGLAYAIRAVETYEVTEQDRLANSAPLHFDISTFEILAGPLAGACSILIPEPYLKMPASLSTLIANEAATFWYSVPSLLSELATRGALDQRDLTSLRWILFGGEVVSPATIRTLMNHCPNARFSNIYGPAEVNQCTYYHLPCEPADSEQVPIGYQWRDAQIEIVDDMGVVVNPGTVGELIVCTPTMMLGYWKQNDLTQRSMTTKTNKPGIWYHTGDLAHMDADGLLHFHGRRDNQVKVRGNRVELESVEAALAESPDVLHGVAAVRGVGIDARLVAIVMLAPNATADPVQIMRAVAGRLPAYAVPDSLTITDTFPLTPSGKLDRALVRKQLNSPEFPYA